MVAKLDSRLRYRLALRSLVVPPPQDSAYFSRCGGLWTDRRNADDEIDRRLDAGTISESEAERLRHWVAHGYMVLEQAVAPEICDRVRADLDRAFMDGDERLFVHSPAHGEYQRLAAGLNTERARVVDVYAYYDSAREALFSRPIIDFLRTIFDDTPLLFQSLTFEKGSQQPLHQDTVFVVAASPLEFAASWIALEDIQAGSGELVYFDGSHRLPEYLFSGKYKHWNAKRDGDQQFGEWQDQLYRNAERMALERKTFLPKKGDVLIWSADLAHGGSDVADPSLTRKSLVGHYAPTRVGPFYFKLEPSRRTTRGFNGGLYASEHYRISEASGSRSRRVPTL